MTSCLWLFPSGTAGTMTFMVCATWLVHSTGNVGEGAGRVPILRVNTSHRPCQGSWCCEEGEKEGGRVGGERAGTEGRTARQDD